MKPAVGAAYNVSFAIIWTGIVIYIAPCYDITGIPFFSPIQAFGNPNFALNISSLGGFTGILDVADMVGVAIAKSFASRNDYVLNVHILNTLEYGDGYLIVNHSLTPPAVAMAFHNATTSCLISNSTATVFELFVSGRKFLASEYLNMTTNRNCSAFANMSLDFHLQSYCYNVTVNIFRER